jgi:autotransporter-associated beta strand protein/T5SS/PEP-CTERM-associated repeat protein
MAGRRLSALGTVLALTAGLLGAPASAADIFWFANGMNQGGTGNWSAAGMTWSTTAPAPTLTVWDPNSTGVFAGLTGTVTITDMNIDAAVGLRWETDLYTLTGGSLTLTGAASATNALHVAAASTATSNSVIKGTAGLTKVGPGTLVLAATNTFTGETVVEGGTLELRGANAPATNCYVGYVNSSTTLALTNGGTLVCPASYLAVTVGSANNTANVNGTGSKWTSTTDLAIGYLGATNQLTVGNAGEVALTNGFIGYGPMAATNSVLITGMGSKWSNSNVVYVGHDGSGNEFEVEDGGYALSSKDAVLGFNSGSANNALRVKDAGSKFEVASGFTLVVGDNGDTNVVEISAGGVLMGHNVRLARSANSSGNSVTVTGTGSAWTNTGTIRVGTLGPGNSVTVASGGAVSFDGNAFIGHGLAAANNTVTVRDAGSTWTSGQFTVGLASVGNVLTVQDGGAVAASSIPVATNPGSAGTINIGVGGAPGTLSGPIQFGDGTGIVNFNHNAVAYAFNPAISGAGAVNFLGSGTTVLNATSTYSGATTVSAGTVRLGVTNALPSSGTFVFAGGALDANGQSAVLGPLSLQASATLRFANSPGGQSIVFASALPYGGGLLTITGYRPGQDHLFITADPNASGVLAHIQFAGYPVGARWIPETGEVLPPPNRTAAAPTLTPVGVAIALTVLCAIAGWALARQRSAQR